MIFTIGLLLYSLNNAINLWKGVLIMKKTFIGLCFGLMVVILIVFGFSTSGFNKKITRIDFPVIGGLLPHDVEYKIDSNVEFSDSCQERKMQMRIVI